MLNQIECKKIAVPASWLALYTPSLSQSTHGFIDDFMMLILSNLITRLSLSLSLFLCPNSFLLMPGASLSVWLLRKSFICCCRDPTGKKTFIWNIAESIRKRLKTWLDNLQFRSNKANVPVFLIKLFLHSIHIKHFFLYTNQTTLVFSPKKQLIRKAKCGR